MFCATNECDSDSKKCCFFLSKMNGYQKKMCNTNQNVTKMDVIIKGVYSTKLESKHASSCKTQFLFTQVKFSQMKKKIWNFGIFINFKKHDLQASL